MCIRDSQSTVPDTDSSSSMEDRSDSVDSTSGVDDSDPTVGTADSLETKLKDLIDDRRVVENVYVEIPIVRLENIIVSNEEIHNYIDNDWIEQNKRWKDSALPMSIKFDDVDADYVQFKSDAKKEVSYLVKEFSYR